MPWHKIGFSTHNKHTKQTKTVLSTQTTAVFELA